MTKLVAWAQCQTYSLLHREDGSQLVEYALIITFVALAALVALTLLGTNLSGKLTSIASKLA